MLRVRSYCCRYEAATADLSARLQELTMENEQLHDANGDIETHRYEMQEAVDSANRVVSVLMPVASPGTCLALIFIAP